MYLYLIICLICLFIVRQNSMMKYMTKIGQNTGTLKTWKKVMKVAMMTARVDRCQNLNSGSRRINGLNSAFELLVGRDMPSSSLISAKAGSILGVRNIKNKLR